MNRSEVKQLLNQAASCDQYPREVTETDVLAWRDVLADLRAEDVAGVIAWHYRRQTRRLMPADVRAYVRDVRAGRISKAADEAPGDPDDVPGYIRRLADRKARIGDGRDVSMLPANPAPPPPAITGRPGRNVGPLMRACRHCKAIPGERCHNGVRTLRGFHPSRIEDAARAKEDA